ncbi:HAD-IIA family hydrolase [Bacillus spizizenii]|uniref:HAD-IIA family hydrolase n=1 Tax=Bacillus spizizenii TaxID=96241 RepID=UPI001F0B1466|nr:HAD-IIA family hydrolase [Bacillus spizizenii]
MIYKEYDVFLFDLDGVIYIGDKALPEAVSSLKRLREEKKSIRFLTNDPCVTRETIVKRLHKLGISASIDEVITSGWATADYLVKAGVKRAYILGNDELKSEIQKAGIDLEEDLAEAVVIGWDNNITFQDIHKAVNLIRRGASFIATNGDKTFPTANGPAPATGAIVAAVKTGADKKPIIIGKPESSIFEKVLESFEDKERCVMIGDTPETDIIGANRMGIASILVSDQNTLFPVEHDFRNPDVVIRDLKYLFDSEVKIEVREKPDYQWTEQVKAGVAGIIIKESSSVLLMKRADNGLWGIPSGHVEPGESVEQAIIREIKEETGLTVKVSKMIGVYSDPSSQTFIYPDGRVSHFITNCFQCEVIGGTLKKSTEEALEVRYFNIHELPDNLLPMHPRWLEDALAQKDLAFIR